MKESEKSAYIHGYGFEEKERLIQQAYYWKDSLILKNLHLDNDKSLLEIGCGVGAVLGILGQEYPGLTLTGIELEPLQFQLADDYLEELGLKNVNLQQGNINKLPWDDNHFDYVYGIWIFRTYQRAYSSPLRSLSCPQTWGTNYLNRNRFKNAFSLSRTSRF